MKPLCIYIHMCNDQLGLNTAGTNTIFLTVYCLRGILIWKCLTASLMRGVAGAVKEVTNKYPSSFLPTV